LDENDELIGLDCIKLNISKLDNIYKKADFIFEMLPTILSKFDLKATQIKDIFVEENAKRFSEGFSSADTILTLAKMNGIVSWMARKVFSGAEIVEVNVSSARAKAGIKIDRTDKTLSVKEKVFIANTKAHPEFPWPKHLAKTGKHKDEVVFDVCARDMSDAYVIVKGGKAIKAIKNAGG
jgi:hypothetical protein